MAKPEEIRNQELRGLVESAHERMRSGEPSEAVKLLVEAYLKLLELRPEILDEKIEIRPGREFPAVMRWPGLGANLDMKSVLEKKPRIEFTRDRFALSEAITYYEFTLESAIAKGV